MPNEQCDVESIISRLESTFKLKRPQATTGNPAKANLRDFYILSEVVVKIAEKCDQMNAEISRLNDKVKTLNDLVISKDEEIARLSSSESRSGVLSMNMCEKGEEWVNKSQKICVINEVVADLNERKERENNVIVFGLNEKITSESLLENLRMDKTKVKKKHTLRMKKTTSTSDPVVIEFNSREDRNEMLRKARVLRKSDDPDMTRIFVNPDLTLAERVKEKQLREERNKKNKELDELRSKDPTKYNYYFGIRNGKVKRIQKENVN